MLSTLQISSFTIVFAVISLCQGCTILANNNIRESSSAESQSPPTTSSVESQSLPAASTPDQQDICNLPAETVLDSAEQPYKVLDEQNSPQYEVSGNEVFRAATLPSQSITFDERAMLSVLQATHDYFIQHGCQDLKILRNGLLGTQDIQISDVLKTLDFMIQVLQADLSAGQPTRLKDPDFINQNFKIIRWLAFDPEVPNETRVRITKYAVFTHPGSRQRTDAFNTPIYEIEDELVEDEFYTRYTKQDVLGGIYEPGGSEFGKVETLAYLTRESFEDALMQGTVLVNLTDGSSAFFNVDKNNGIAYVPGLDPWQQERYWYFREVNQLKGYGYRSEAKILIEPGVTFAGDVLNIGLGKIVAFEDLNQSLRLGIIADTGGAFLPNLRQLDFFAGVFPSWDDYQQSISQLPEYTQAYILLKK